MLKYFRRHAFLIRHIFGLNEVSSLSATLRLNLRVSAILQNTCNQLLKSFSDCIHAQGNTIIYKQPNFTTRPTDPNSQNYTIT